MDTTFYEFGIEMLRWQDENGNTWEARKDEVELFGKECFECFPVVHEDGTISLESGLGPWSVTFNDSDANGLLLASEEDEEYTESFK